MMKYFISADGEYREGDENDFAWRTYGSGSTEVPQRPSREHTWNGSSWVRQRERLEEIYIARKFSELRESQLYMSMPNITTQQETERDNYITALWNLDFSDPGNFSFPSRPQFMQE